MTLHRKDMTLYFEDRIAIFATGLARLSLNWIKPQKSAIMKHLYQLAALAALSLFVSLSASAQERQTTTESPTEESISEESIHRTITENPAPEGYVEAGSISIVDPQTGEKETRTVYEAPRKSLYMLYREGGYVCMTLITLCLVAAFLSAWKAPCWIKEFGQLALLLGIIYLLLGFYDIAKFIGSEGIEIGKDVPSSILFSGLRVALIAPLYGLIVYGITLVLRIALKPRI